MLFWARNARIPKELLAELSWWSSHDLVFHSRPTLLFSLTERIKRCKMILKTFWLIVWLYGKNSAWPIPRTSKKKKSISIILVLDLNTRAFLGFGDNALFHSRLCRLVSGSHSKIQDSLPVTTLFSKLGTVSSCSKMSWQTCIHCSFCPTLSNFGTILCKFS